MSSVIGILSPNNLSNVQILESTFPKDFLFLDPPLLSKGRRGFDFLTVIS